MCKVPHLEWNNQMPKHEMWNNWLGCNTAEKNPVYYNEPQAERQQWNIVAKKKKLHNRLH